MSSARQRVLTAGVASLLGHAVLAMWVLDAPVTDPPPSPTEIAFEPVALIETTRPPRALPSSTPTLAAPTPDLPHRPAPRRPAIHRQSVAPVTKPITAQSFSLIGLRSDVAIVAAPVAEPSPAPPSSGSSSAPVSATVGPGTLGAASVPDDDHGALGKIQAQLAQAAPRCYPRSARRLGLAGETVVRFCVDGTGSADKIEVLLSSGHESLDEAASDCVIREAAPFPALKRCVSVPVRFEVRDPSR